MGGFITNVDRVTIPSHIDLLTLASAIKRADASLLDTRLPEDGTIVLAIHTIKSGAFVAALIALGVPADQIEAEIIIKAHPCAGFLDKKPEEVPPLPPAAALKLEKPEPTIETTLENVSQRMQLAIAA